MSGGGEQSSCRGLVDTNRGPGMLAACVGTGDEACRCFYSRPATAAHSRVFWTRTNTHGGVRGRHFDRRLESGVLLHMRVACDRCV